jgi:hypothetical protein
VTVEPLSSALSFAFLASRLGAGLLGVLGTLLAMVGLYGIVSSRSAGGPPSWESA